MRRQIRVMLSVLLVVFGMAFSAWGQTYHKVLALNGTCGNPTSGVLPVYLANSNFPVLYGVCDAASYDGSNVPGGIFEVQKSGGWKQQTTAYFVGYNADAADGGGVLLRDATGVLYGTSSLGGTWERGDIYAAYPNGIVTPLYEFTCQSDGCFPSGGLTVDAAGHLYGTAANGGNFSTGSQCNINGCGVVFELVKGTDTYGRVSWTYTVLYAFPADGSGNYPLSPVVLDSDGNIYGTTYQGGNDTCGSVGCGTVFKLTTPAPGETQWTASTIYEFTGGTDGSSPMTGVILDSSGNLYGGTNAGGTYEAGTVYQLISSANGYTEKTLYALDSIRGQYFAEGSNLVFDASGNLWGTAVLGATDGNGAVFELIANSWKYKEVHKFAGGSDSETPMGPLTLDSKGNIWGTTYGFDLSGTTGQAGSIFEITPAK